MGTNDEGLMTGPDCWHPPFYQLVIERGPPTLKAETEFELNQRARRIDMVLTRMEGEQRDKDARVLRGLWPRVGEFVVLEFKSAREDVAKRVLLDLFDYGIQYHAMLVDRHKGELRGQPDLTLVLVMPYLTPNLKWAIEHMDGWELEPLGNGYARVLGPCYTTLIAFTDEVCEAEKDEYLRLFSRHKEQSRCARGWMIRYFTRKTTMEDLRNTDDFEELLAEFFNQLKPEERERMLSHLKPEERLVGLEPEERLAGLKPEERLVGLEPEERLVGLEPEERLVGLDPDELVRALRSLPPGVRDLVREKLNGS